MATLPTVSNENENGPKPRITVGLDIGTSKVCALIASYDEDTDNLNILGIGITDSEGLNRGVVVNIDKTVKTIKKVIEQAEQQAGITIEEVVVGIAGDHIEAFQSRGIIGISNNNREIVQEDVDRIIKESRNIKLPPERNILHVIPQEFIIEPIDSELYNACQNVEYSSINFDHLGILGSGPSCTLNLSKFLLCATFNDGNCLFDFCHQAYFSQSKVTQTFLES